MVTAIKAAPTSDSIRSRALTELTSMLAVQAIPASDITPAGIIHFGLALRDVSAAQDKHGRQLAGGLLRQVLVDAGRFPEGTPVTMRVAMVGGRKTVIEFVDTYGVTSPEVRQLLIDYVSHRSVLGMDYGTVCALVRSLVRTFWCIVERVNPGAC